MADFSTQLSEVQGVGVSRGSPAPSSSALAVAKGIEGAANLFAESRKAEAEQMAEQLKNAAISDFTQSQLRIANAVERGELKPQSARMQMRANVQQALVANPALSEDILKIQGTLTSTKGLAKSAAGQAEDIDSMISEATEKGWVKPNMTKEQQFQASLSYASFKRENELLSQKQAQLTYENSQLEQKSKIIGISRSELALNRFRREELGRKALSTLADAYMPKFRTDMDTVIGQFENGEISAEEAVRAVNANFQTVQGVVNTIGIDAGRDYITTVVEPLKRMKEDSLKLVNGEMSGDLYKQRVDTLIAQTQLNALRSSDDFRRYAAISRLMPSVPAEFVANATLVTQDLWSKLGNSSNRNGNLIGEDDKDSVKGYLDGMSNVLDNPERLDDQAKQERDTHVVNILKSIPQYSASADRLSDYAPVAKFLASPAFGKYVKEKGGIPAEQAEQAKDVLQSEYIERVLPTIQEEYSRAGVQFSLGLGETPPSGADSRVERGEGLLGRQEVTQPAVATVEPVFSGTGVRFRPVQGLSGSAKEAAVNKSQDLNKKVSPLLNQFIRMSAHLDGHQRYNEVFQENFTNFFAPSPEQEQ